jgi:hypothetical protein
MNVAIPVPLAPRFARDRSSRTRETLEARAAARRLLIPVDATERSRWGLRYAQARHRAGEHVDAALLYVAEPITNWQVLRFRTQEEVARLQSERGQFLLEDAALALRQAGIPHQTVFREGEPTFHMLDVAEQLDCNEIVLPEPPPRLLALLSRDRVRDVLRQQRHIPVVTVNEYGTTNGMRVEG